MKINIWLILITVSLALCTCQKAEDRRCFKKPGEQTTIERTLPTFTHLRIHPNMEVILVPDTEHKMFVRGGKNLVNHIHTSTDKNGFLHIINENKCSFLKSYKKQKIVVEVHFVELKQLFFEGTHDLTTQDTIKTSNFILDIIDGSGTVHLTTDCGQLEVYQGHGYGNFIIDGKAKQALLSIQSNGFGNTTNLKVDTFLIVNNKSPVRSYVNADGVLDFYVQIEKMAGDIVYTGNPQNIHTNLYGKGQLINGNN